MFKSYIEEKLEGRKGQEVIDKEFLHTLTTVEDSEWDKQEQNEVTGKRKRKLTAVMEASKCQEIELNENSTKKRKNAESKPSSLKSQKQNTNSLKQTDTNSQNKKNVDKLSQASAVKSKASVKAQQKKAETLASIEIEGTIQNVPFGLMKQFNQQVPAKKNSSSNDAMSVTNASPDKTELAELLKPATVNYLQGNTKEAASESDSSVESKARSLKPLSVIQHADTQSQRCSAKKLSHLQKGQVFQTRNQ